VLGTNFIGKKTKKSMKILHVLTSPRAEGTPRLVLDWLTVKEHQQYVLFLQKEPADLLNSFSSTEVFVNPQLPKGYKKIAVIFNVVKKICKTFKPDVVIAWNTGLAPFILFSARLTNVKKLIAHCGNAPSESFFGKYIYTWFTFYVCKIIGAKIVCCSNYLKHEFCSIPLVPKKNVYSVHNCVNQSKFNGINKSVNQLITTAIMVATLEPHKDHVTLLKAWKIVENTLTYAKLQLVGSGSLELKLKILARDLGLKNVEFLGSREDVPELLKKADFFVFSTTHNEGFGTVLIEALSVGLPIIATNVPACNEVLQEGKYGYLVEPYNEYSLAEAIMHVFQDKSFFDEEKINERKEYAASFSPKAMIDKYLSILNP